jgi:hypothetical protein
MTTTTMSQTHAATEVRAAKQHVRVQRDDDDPGGNFGEGQIHR